MSRIGKKGVSIPEKTEVSFDKGTIYVKGPKGNLERAFRPGIKIRVEGNNVSFTPEKINQQTKVLWGTYASHVKNMIKGVNEGFEKKLILEGVGYKSEIKSNKLVLSLGFSHLVEMLIPEGITMKTEKNTLSISGIDKEAVGQFAASVRDMKKPEPYKGKGFRYQDEIIRRKEGKKSV